MSLEIRVRGNSNFSFSLFYVLSFVSFLRAKKPKESTKENKENTHRFLRLHGALRRSAVFSFRLRRIFFASQTPYGQTVLGFSRHFCNYSVSKTTLKSKHRKDSSHLPSCNTILIVLHDYFYKESR